MRKNSILYIKSNLDELDLGSILKDSSIEISYCDYRDGLDPLIKKVKKGLPKIILIEVENVKHEFLSFLLLLNSLNKPFTPMVIAIFPDKDTSNKFFDIFSFGIQYGFLACEENKRIRADLLYFLDPSSPPSEVYALASNLSIPANIRITAKISHISKSDKGNTLSLETSLKMEKSDELYLKLLHDEDEHASPTSFDVVKTNSFIPRSYFKQVATLATKDKLFFKNFIPRLKATAFFRNEKALIIDLNIDTFCDIATILNRSDNFIKIVDKFKFASESLLQFRPQFIFFNFQKEDDDLEEDEKLNLNGFSSFNQLVSLVNSIPDYQPYIFAFNELSRSRAFRKAYDYEQIIVQKSSFKLSFLELVIEEFQERFPLNNQNNTFIRSPDKNSIIEIIDQITLTEFSEREVSFLSDKPFSPFTNFRLSIPFDVNITVLPNNSGEEKRGDQFFFKGIISCTSEETKMELRKLVNLLIQLDLQPDEIFKLKSVSDLREDIIIKKAQELKLERQEQLKKLK